MTCIDMLKILIIDDSAIIRERLSDMLTEIDDIEIMEEATSALNGLDLVRSRNPDLVILDIRMSNSCGIDTLEEIKKTCPAPLVAVLTNYPYPAYRKRCMGLGADYFFDKSSEFYKLTDVVKDLINDVGF